MPEPWSLTRNLRTSRLLFKMQTALKNSFYLPLTLMETLGTPEAHSLLNTHEIRDLRTSDKFSGCLLGLFR